MSRDGKIDSTKDFTNRGLKELEAWLEPWFLNRSRGGITGLEYVSTVWTVDAAPSIGDRFHFNYDSTDASLGGAWFTRPSAIEFTLATGTYLVRLIVQFGDPYMTGGTPLVTVTDGVATLATGGAATPTGNPWVLLIANCATPSVCAPFTHSLISPAGVTAASVIVVRMNTVAGA